MAKTIDDKRRKFLLDSTVAAGAVAMGGSLAACSDSGPGTPESAAVFSYGVASGDPLADRVMLWTYAKYPDSTNNVTLTWQIATDATFANIVASGNVDATEANGFTAKVDASGLTAGTTYAYRFKGRSNAQSAVGTTRTLPTGSIASLKFAVFSCSLYSAGFFNAYDSAATSDAQFAVHLGDYIYEYGAAASQFGNVDAATIGRIAVPANDIVTLADYRARYAQYRGDPMLQALHAKMPWITVWDDHEFANNAYVGGAENQPIGATAR